LERGLLAEGYAASGASIALACLGGLGQKLAPIAGK
jgi:hypothetical protein|tara:strand:+ start:246 stop:353 length:108 start_codon:yes stop_codon:yes gene_type:complete